MFDNFPENSKVWVYPSSRILNIEDELVIKRHLNEFILGWNAHGLTIKGSYEIYKQNFIVLVADQDYSTVSGCSIDSSVKCIKAIGNELNVDFFNRLLLITEKEGELKRVSFPNLSEESATYVYDTGVSNLSDLRVKFKVSVSEYLISFMVK